MPGRKFDAGSEYRYGFNGKEKDNGVEAGTYDFGARIYDSRIGRWESVDLIINAYVNPYNYGANNPTNYLDPNGEDIIHFYEVYTKTNFDGKIILNKSYKFSVVEKNNEPNVFIHHKLELRYDAILGPATVTKLIDTKFYPDVPGKSSGLSSSYCGLVNDSDRKTLIKFIDIYGLSKQDVDASGGMSGYTEVNTSGAPISDRIKKAHWWADVFSEKTFQEKQIAEEKSKANFLLAAASLLAPELLFSRLGKTTEVFYRTMSEADAAIFEATGTLPAGTETMISPTLAYAKSLEGVTFEIRTQAGTIEKLLGMGVRDNSKLTQSLGLPSVKKGWKSENAFFKAESNSTKGLAPQINIGLGNGKALEAFNNAILSFSRL